MSARSSPPSLDEALSRLPLGLRGMARDLLVYKALLQDEWLNALARHAADPAEASVIEKLHRDARGEAQGVLDAMAAWGATGASSPEAAARLRTRMLTDLLYLKESTTEAVLLAGMRAPTNALRLEFVRLADIDRQHADALRALLGTPSVHSFQDATGTEGESVGAYGGRGDAASFSQRVSRAVADLRADGQDPCGLVFSAVALRHARDEGLLGRDDGTALGLPVDVDFGWRGECFCVQTRERVTLAEIIAERSAGRES